MIQKRSLSQRRGKPELAVAIQRVQEEKEKEDGFEQMEDGSEQMVMLGSRRPPNSSPRRSRNANSQPNSAEYESLDDSEIPDYLGAQAKAKLRGKCVLTLRELMLLTPMPIDIASAPVFEGVPITPWRWSSSPMRAKMEHDIKMEEDKIKKEEEEAKFEAEHPMMPPPVLLHLLRSLEYSTIDMLRHARPEDKPRLPKEALVADTEGDALVLQTLLNQSPRVPNCGAISRLYWLHARLSMCIEQWKELGEDYVQLGTRLEATLERVTQMHEQVKQLTIQ